MTSMEALRQAFETAKERLGCGDNSCMFEKPRGMATNGGCRCLGRDGGQRPGAYHAMANLYLAVKVLLQETQP